VTRTADRSLEIVLAGTIASLALVASAAGLFVAGVYRDPPSIVSAIRGQDAVTLAAVPLVLAAAWHAHRGALRSRLVELGLLGYVIYTYAGAAFGYRFNHFFLIYIALLSLSLLALLLLLRRLSMTDVRRAFDAGVPRRPVAVFLMGIGLLLAALELGEIGEFIVTDAVPESVQRAGGTTFFPYVLDLGFIVPLSAAAAIGLWRDVAWSYALAGILLVKATTMGCALLAMNWWTVRAGLSGDGLNLFYGLLAAGGLAMTMWFFRHCRASKESVRGARLPFSGS
jgi:hypothetical protein